MWAYNYTYELYHSDELYHYGIPGMKWGHRKARPVDVAKNNYRMAKAQARNDYKTAKAQYKADVKKAKQEYKNSPEYQAKQAKRAKIKKAVAVGTAIAGTALAVYGAYKLNKAIKTKAYNKSYEKGKAMADSIFSANYVTKSSFNDAKGTYEFKNRYGESISTGRYKGDSGYREALNYLDRRNRNTSDTYNETMRNVREIADYNSRNLRSSIRYLRKGY